MSRSRVLFSPRGRCSGGYHRTDLAQLSTSEASAPIAPPRNEPTSLLRSLDWWVLTRALAEEGLGQIRANCVVPGVMETQRKVGQPPPIFDGDDMARARGTSEDVARAVLSLADPRDSYVTGQTLHVSGGRFMP